LIHLLCELVEGRAASREVEAAVLAPVTVRPTRKAV